MYQWGVWNTEVYIQYTVHFALSRGCNPFKHEQTFAARWLALLRVNKLVRRINATSFSVLSRFSSINIHIYGESCYKSQWSRISEMCPKDYYCTLKLVILLKKQSKFMCCVHVFVSAMLRAQQMNQHSQFKQFKFKVQLLDAE